MSVKPQGELGIDAPWVPWLWIVIAAGTAALTVASSAWGTAWWNTALTWYFGACTLICLIGAALYWHASLRGKLILWERLLSRLQLPPDAHVLDLGCGHGAVAIMTASQFPQATVHGVDIWRTADQSGNSLPAAERNAAMNGLGDRVHFSTANMTELPCGDGQFDLVTASMAIHNIPTAQGRRTALGEAVRVLAPGGRLCIVDIRCGREYADELRRLGLSVDGPRGLGWQGWWTGPWMATSAVCAVRSI